MFITSKMEVKIFRRNILLEQESQPVFEYTEIALMTGPLVISESKT